MSGGKFPVEEDEQEGDLERGSTTVVAPGGDSELQERRGGQRLRLRLPDFEEIRPTPQDFSFSDLKPSQKEPSPTTSSDNGKTEAKLPSTSRRTTLHDTFRARTAWMRDKMDMSHLKPVIRCAVAAWVSLLLVVIPSSERLLGQVRASTIPRRQSFIQHSCSPAS